MSLLTVVQDVCAFVGVERPTSVFADLNANRTQQEMLALANETAQAIAYDERDWKRITSLAQMDGASGIDAGYSTSAFLLPENYKRMLLTANVRRSTAPTLPLRFIPDQDEWARRRLSNWTDPWGEWTINTGRLFVHPLVPAGTLISFPYLVKNHIFIAGSPPPGVLTDTFANDSDVFFLDERLLKLGMIWRWKQSKGSPYAEDMSNYEIALSRVAGADSPSPIIAGRMPVSAAARVAIPWPPDWGPQP